jgi:hypothetical protein
VSLERQDVTRAPRERGDGWDDRGVVVGSRARLLGRRLLDSPGIAIGTHGGEYPTRRPGRGGNRSSARSPHFAGISATQIVDTGLSPW